MYWHRVGHPSDFEKQAIESRPCPQCGAYTLTCRDPKPPARRTQRGGTRAAA